MLKNLEDHGTVFNLANDKKNEDLLMADIFVNPGENEPSSDDSFEDED